MYEFYNRSFKCWNGKDLIFTLREGTADFDSIQSSVVEDEYGLKEFDFKDNDVIIDIGAETGGEAVSLGSLNPRLKIFSFEPIPENFELLKVNLMNNNIFNVIPCLYAVGGQTNKIKIYYGSMDSETGRRHHFIGNALNISKGNYVEANLINLQEIFIKFALEKVKVLKIDAEGAEVDILKSTSGDILSKVDWIIGEHHDRKREEILKLTKDLFIDTPCPHQSNKNLGHFRFKNKNL